MITILRWLVRLLYHFSTWNEAVLDTAGPVLLLPNHVSWWDWLLIGVCLEEDWRFVTSSASAETSWFHKKIMVNRRTFPVDMNSPYAIKRMAEYLQGGGRLVLFPEGRITSTGSLMKLFDGTGFLILKTHAKVITAYIRGAERLPFSRNPGLKRWFPRISVHFSAVLTPPNLGNVSVSQGRARMTEWLRHQMVRLQFETEMEFGPATLPAAINKAAALGPGRVVLQDFTLQGLSYRRLLLGANLLAERWRELLKGAGERVGVLMPNVNGMPAVLLSLWAAGKVPAILNYTTGARVLLSCAELAQLKYVITSKAFIAGSKLEVGGLKQAGIQIVFLEDVRQGISRTRRLLGMLGHLFRPQLAGGDLRHEDTAVVLFTSGSEGIPKGVELSHKNVLANIRQMLSVIDLMETDRFFNALPLFHCFGLTVGLLLPLVRRVFTFVYLSPLHYRVVPSAFYNLDCTVFFGTNTFLNGYGRKAHPYDFRSLRYLFVGAEKLQPSTASFWMEKFGVRVLEGYGATECSPCISVNVPMSLRTGTGGQFLPDIEYRLEPVEGISAGDGSLLPRESLERSGEENASTAAPRDGASGTEAGRLFVRGPNVMRGYLNAEANEKFKALGGWLRYRRYREGGR